MLLVVPVRMLVVRATDMHFLTFKQSMCFHRIAFVSMPKSGISTMKLVGLSSRSHSKNLRRHSVNIWT